MHEQSSTERHGASTPTSATSHESGGDAPRYEITESTFCDHDTDSEFVLRCRGRRLIIRLFERHFSESPRIKEQYIFFLRVVDEGELDGLTLDDMHDWVMEPFLPVLRNIPSRDAESEVTLQDLVSAETWVYTLKIVAGELSPTRCEATRHDIDRIEFGVPLSKESYLPWQSFQPSDIRICNENLDEALAELPGKVTLVGDATPYYLKLPEPGTQHSTERELATYKKIRELSLDSSVRVSRLRGLVRDDNGMVYGLLLSYINAEGWPLTCVLQPQTSEGLRHKWKDQITSTVDALHKAGIVWGDVKADNVLVDDQDDAWVVDFGGGYTKGWVQEQSAGTVAGDIEGLNKILKYIGD